MVFRVQCFLIVSLLPLLWLLGESMNFSYPAVFNFGDSNSDTGGVVAGIGFTLGRPNGETYFHKPSGRFCDGRLIIDFLMDAMGLPLLNPYLDSIGAPNFQRGCNFATGGSTILAENADISPFSFGIQVAQFLRFKARVIELLNTDEKLAEYLPQKNYFVQGLYMIDVGQNDIDASFYSKSAEQVIASIPALISELKAGIKQLYNQGARRFWIHNTGPLGCLPRIINTFGKDPSKLDELGCVASHNNAAKHFNLQLHALCRNFQGQFPDANVSYFDVFTIKFNLISNYCQFGFEHSRAACCGYGGLPLNYDGRIQCGQTKILNGSSVTAKPCENSLKYINWDGNHYTEAANLHVSSQILTGNYSDPPLAVP